MVELTASLPKLGALNIFVVILTSSASPWCSAVLSSSAVVVWNLGSLSIAMLAASQLVSVC